jgi:imidazolonepropionase-like amidohydrolase
MRRTLHVRPAVLAALLLASAALLAHGTERHDFKLVNGLWFDGKGFVPRTVFTVGGVFRDAYDGKVEATLDLAGKYVVPPFGDAHNHALGGGPDPERQVKTFLAQGVFYLKNPNELPRLAAPFRAIVNQPRGVDVTYSHGGLTASGGHPVQLYESLVDQGAFHGMTKADLPGQAFFVVNDAKELDAEWPKVLEGKPDFVKVYLEHSEEYAKRKSDPAFFGKRGLDPALLPEIVKRAHAAHLRVTAHARTVADFRAALAAGVDELAHLPLGRLTEDDARRAATAKAIVVTTTMSHWDKEGLSDGEVNELHRTNLALLAKAGVTIAFGVDGHVPLLAEVENVRKLGVFDDAALLRMLTTTTPRVIFPSRNIGSLEPGAEASFLALDGNPLEDFSALHRISMRMKQGFVLRLATSVAEPIAEAVRKGGAEAAAKRYRELKTDGAEKWDFAEPELNRLGYALLKEGKPKEAVAVLELNAEAYPRSPNAFDSLSDARLAAGDRAGARAASQKVLELLPAVHDLAPGFRQGLEQNARKRIEELKD